MRRLFRTLGRVLTLPPLERRLRTERVLERWFRRRPVVRRLGIVPDAPRWGSLRRALDCDLMALPTRLRLCDPSRGPLHAELATRVAACVSRHPAEVRTTVDRARVLLDRRFDLLGSGPARPLGPDGAIDWHRDWKSGLAWDPTTYFLDVAIVRGDGSDVKVPWELSRFQHLLVLGQAYHLAPHLLSRTAADELRSRCALESTVQIDSWIRRNPRGVGIHWTCAMEVSIRAVVWIAALAFFRDAPEWDDAFVRRLARALWNHGRHVRRNLEIGGSGLTSNHFLCDLIGLYAIGTTLPELREAGEWRAFARRALINEIDRQVLPDGVDFERSVPYHRLVTEVFLHAALLAQARQEPMPPAYLARLAGMLEFIQVYSRPDGSTPQWGDNDDGRLLPLDGYASQAPHDHRHLLALGGRFLDRPDLAAAAGPKDLEALWLLGPERSVGSVAGEAPHDRAFTAAAYYVLRSRDLHLAVPCGAVGTRGLGNHTHNDLLSLCVWAAGTEWISDPGTGTYSADTALRNRFRSTSAHATLQLGDREQNDFGDGLDDLFRMVDRAAPRVLEWSSDESEARLRAQHEGFTGSDGRWVHERSIRFRRRHRDWLVLDRLRHEGSSEITVASEIVHLRFPLGCGVAGRILAGDEPWPVQLRASLQELSIDEAHRAPSGVGIELRSAGESRFFLALDLPAGSTVALEEGCCSPRYGVVEPATVVIARVPLSARVETGAVLFCPAPVGGSS